MGKSILGRRLKELREKHKLTQKQVAPKFGITNYQLSRYENDESNPDPDLIVKFAEFYGVSSDYLLGKTDKPTYDEDLSRSYYGGPEDITDDEREYLDRQLEQYRELKKQFMEKKEENK
ncbi:helix-turn-helix transcriptional regulator [Bacillus tamaricis]|uniref:Helix-turn-helix transcriptional regulator n=2 Tax=Evansella tamaricis TaxID=2069301 RepID=A0ABS6JBQ9_9BACI|nr:helix-turn-helix transcriptional regulator [Evansella tamaricis]